MMAQAATDNSSPSSTCSLLFPVPEILKYEAPTVFALSLPLFIVDCEINDGISGGGEFDAIVHLFVISSPRNIENEAPIVFASSLSLLIVDC
jgi:hypothetical protein